ncbi:MAG: amino acid adenylation domain-containing protein, partial [Cyanobacteria bacterium P01_A01_bin.84]
MKDISQRLANLSPAKRALLEQQLQKKALQNKQESTISPIKNYQDIPLSFSQQRMWLVDQLEPGNPAYNRPTNISLTGTLNVPVLEKSLNEIIRRHEIFRTSFEEVNGKPFQKINPNITLKLPIIDLSHLEDEKTEIEIQRLAIQEAQQTFDLTQAPLLKAKLVGLNEQEHILLLTMHHIVFDGWSVGVLIKELAAIYGAFLTAKTSPLPELSIQYADFAIWQKQQQQTEKLESQLSYWKKQLGGKLPVLELPADRPRAAVQTFRGAKHSLLLPNHLVTSLKAISLKENVTLFMTLLAGFKILIYRYTSEEDIIVGTPIAGRNRKETEKLIGLFINTLVLRNQLNSKQNFIELLAQVREVALGGYAHQDVPFEKLMEELQPERGLSYTPLFQVLFQLRNFPEETIEVKGLKFDNYHLETGLAMLDLALEIEERAEGLLCVFKYNTDLFDASTIERMAVHFQTLLEGIVDNPRQSISQLPLLNKTQQFSCVLIGQESFIIPCAEKLLQRGHVINGIVSTGQIIHDWAQKREIPCTSSNKNLGYFLKKISFDYLFSISNLKILTAEVLKLPTRGAINLHDALLPKYGGLYAPSWAIFNQESEHGLTWHWITPGIDEGDIIKQIKLPVNESENAFTLNMKCYDAALDSFAEIIDDLAFERIEAQPQNLEQSLYFNAVQRPTPGCIVNWNWTAKTIDALIRCLDFGNYKNPFGNPKLYVEEKFYHINQLEISKEVSDKPSGTIVKLNNDYLQISTASQDVIVRSLQTLEGKNLSWKDWAIEVNLQEGDRLNSLSAEDNQQIEEIEVNCLRSENFWVKQLSNWEPLELPIREKSQTLVFNLPRIQKQSFSASSNIHNFISETSLECSPQDFLLAAFVAYLARISQSKSFSIGIESSIVCSSESKLNQLFSSVVPCNLEINLEQTFTDFFVLVQQQINLAQKSKTFHRDIVTRYPQLANLQNLSIEQQLPITVQLTETLNNYHPKSINKFVLVIAQNGDCACFYDENSYSDITIDNLLQSFAIFIEQLLLHSNDKLTNLSLIPSKDWTDLEQVNNRYVEYQNNLLLHQLFEAQVELTPNAIALQDINNEQTLTYFELNQRANKLAHYLQSKGVQPDVLVGVCVERSVEMLISILAVLKAGGAYVPLDPNYPTERLTLMMTDAKISVLLTQECWISKLPQQEEIFCLDRDWNIVDNLNHQNPVSQAKPEHLAYVIYTSGSTGNPKGVMVQHDSLVNFTQAAVTNYGIVECDHILQFASISFDAAAEEIYPCLICGGTLVLRTDEMLSSVNYFIKKCRDWQITVLDLPTAYWQQIAIELETGNITLPELLRLVIIGGERVSPEYVKIWQKHVADYPQLINTYGPTEGTVVATAYTMTANSNIQHEVSIGKAIANVQTYVLDANLQPLPIGVAGELHIGGMGVARGYLN